MANGQIGMLQPGPSKALGRPSYEAGDYLSARDLMVEQAYRSQRLRRHRRYLHGWGVVCGLLVTAARDPGRPWAVLICPGYALGPWGHEIELRAPAMLDIRDYLWTRPRIGGPPTRLAYVAIRYDEEFVRPKLVGPLGCGCNDPNYVESHIRDGYQLNVLWARPEPHADRFDLCSRQLPPCPECPDSPYVVLARVTLPPGESDPIVSASIDNWSYRRRLYPTRVVQQQLIACCCGQNVEASPPP